MHPDYAYMMGMDVPFDEKSEEGTHQQSETHPVEAMPEITEQNKLDPTLDGNENPSSSAVQVSEKIDSQYGGDNKKPLSEAEMIKLLYTKQSGDVMPFIGPKPVNGKDVVANRPAKIPPPPPKQEKEELPPHLAHYEKKIDQGPRAFDLNPGFKWFYKQAISVALIIYILADLSYWQKSGYRGLLTRLKLLC